jgi:hypothetical protein
MTCLRPRSQQSSCRRTTIRQLVCLLVVGCSPGFVSLENLLLWNVRGLHARSYRDTVRQLIAAEKPSLVCLQETKLHVIIDFNVMQILSARFDYAYLLADGTRGGILVTWLPINWSISNVSCCNHSLWESEAAILWHSLVALGGLWTGQRRRENRIPSGAS